MIQILGLIIGGLIELNYQLGIDMWLKMIGVTIAIWVFLAVMFLIFAYLELEIATAISGIFGFVSLWVGSTLIILCVGGILTNLIIGAMANYPVIT